MDLCLDPLLALLPHGNSNIHALLVVLETKRFKPHDPVYFYTFCCQVCLTFCRMSSLVNQSLLVTAAIYLKHHVLIFLGHNLILITQLT